MVGKPKKTATSNYSKVLHVPKQSGPHSCEGGIGHQFQMVMEPFYKERKSATGGYDTDHDHKYLVFVCVKCGAGLEVRVSLTEGEK
jgi:hypothetical protein